jgi:hypothetical protein
MPGYTHLQHAQPVTLAHHLLAYYDAFERDIQREIGRYTDGYVDVHMLSDTKSVVYIEDKDVPTAAVSMERALSGRAVPGCIAPSRDIDVSAAVYGNATGFILSTRPIEGVPCIGRVDCEWIAWRRTSVSKSC